jgi:hypothetical protein
MNLTTMMTDPATRFLPTLEQARAKGLPLPAGEPFEQEKWAALFVIATVLRRRSWREEMASHPDNVAALGRGMPPAPEAFVGGTYATLESIGEPTPCLACSLTPGRRKCRVCNGLNFVQLVGSDKPVRCSCTMGYVPCPTCRGQATTNRVVLRYYEDTPATMRELYLPSHLPCYAPLFHLESAMEEGANMSAEPPEELRCHDLTGQVGGSAYRGGSRTVRPTFHGHDFGDTIDRAREQLRALRGGFHVARYEVRAYAWPLLRLRYAPERPSAKEIARPREVALFFNRFGDLKVFGSV